MKSFRLLMVSIFGSLLLMPALVGSVVSAQQQQIECVLGPEVDFACDMSILKEVSVNGGAFLDANTSPEAANASVGNTVIWRVTVSEGSIEGVNFPTGEAYISDVLPGGFTFTSFLPSVGSYDPSSNVWTLPLHSFPVEFPESNLPATLTITSTAAATGLFQNVVTLSEYDPCIDGCIGPVVAFADNFSENNSDGAWVSVSAAPVVLGDSTPVVLAATGSGVLQSAVAGGLILTTLGVLGYSRFARRAL